MDASNPEPSPSLPGVIHQRYEVVRSLGEGRLGRTFEVKDLQVEGSFLTLKVIHPEIAELPRFKDAFLRRGGVAEGLIGEHVNRLRGAEVDDEGRLYLLREHVQGESLADRLAREDMLQPRQTLDIARQVLEALATGHGAGVVHGDARPSRVLLRAAVPKVPGNPYGIDVQLSGFGVPRADEYGEAGAEVIGENLYAAPDWQQEEGADSRADLFAVGMLICEMLLGTRAFHGGAAARIREAVRGGEDARLGTQLQDIEPSLRRILLVALSRRPEGRFPGAEEFGRALEGCDVYAPEKMRAPVSLVVAALIAAAVGLTLAWRSHNELTQYQEAHAEEAREASSALQETLEEQLATVAEQRDAALQRVAELEAGRETRPPQVSGERVGGEGVAGEEGPPAPESDWSEILAAGPDADPQRVFALATLEGDALDPRWLELATAYRDALQSRLVEDGALRRWALEAEPHLAEWSRLLEETPAVRSLPVARDIRLFDYARRLLVDGDSSPPFAEVFDPEAAPRPDWRHEVCLRAACLTPSQWLLKREGERTVFAHRARDQITFVTLEFLQSPAEGRAVIVSEVRGAEGDVINRNQVEVRRSGARFEWNESVVDLLHDPVRLEAFQPDPELSALDVPRQAGVREVQRRRWVERVGELSESERLCLVLSVGAKEYWLSPSLGLVRSVEGQVEQELVAAVTTE